MRICNIANESQRGCQNYIKRVSLEKLRRGVSVRQEIQPDEKVAMHPADSNRRCVYSAG